LAGKVETMHRNWLIGIEKIYHRSGSGMPLKKFKRDIKALFNKGQLLEYKIRYGDINNCLIVSQM